MNTCKLNGGLGNQLFQIFNTISHSLDTKTKFAFVYERAIGIGTRCTYWDSFLSSLKIFTYSTMPKSLIVKEQAFHYTKIPHFGPQIIMFVGYYQSYKYFSHNFETIQRLIRLDNQKNNIKKSYIHDYDNLVSMHFRLGDYKFIQNYHPIATYEYYRNSIQYILYSTQQSSLKILYFCEENDNDAVLVTINKLRETFPSCHFIKTSDIIEDWIQMLMMSCCKHNIIANSSFSWWGAYFNSHTDKIVCYPSRWFGPDAIKNNTMDLFPEHWNMIDM